VTHPPVFVWKSRFARDGLLNVSLLCSLARRLSGRPSTLQGTSTLRRRPVPPRARLADSAADVPAGTRIRSTLASTHPRDATAPRRCKPQTTLPLLLDRPRDPQRPPRPSARSLGRRPPHRLSQGTTPTPQRPAPMTCPNRLRWRGWSARRRRRASGACGAGRLMPAERGYLGGGEAGRCARRSSSAGKGA
jgi:hypothetical protein